MYHQAIIKRLTGTAPSLGVIASLAMALASVVVACGEDSRDGATLEPAATVTATPAATPTAGSSLDGGYYDANGNWVHDTGLGFEAIEAVDGFTANGPQEIEIGGTTIVLPQTKGLTWGSGDTGYGYGIVIRCPNGTNIFFSLVERKAYVDTSLATHPGADATLVAEILASADTYQVVNSQADLPPDAHAPQKSPGD